jgi:hypothetical protein
MIKPEATRMARRTDARQKGQAGLHGRSPDRLALPRHERGFRL